LGSDNHHYGDRPGRLCLCLRLQTIASESCAILDVTHPTSAGHDLKLTLLETLLPLVLVIEKVSKAI